MTISFGNIIIFIYTIKMQAQGPLAKTNSNGLNVEVEPLTPTTKQHERFIRQWMPTYNEVVKANDKVSDTYSE